MFLFFSLGLKSGLPKFINTIHMFGYYLKTWVHLMVYFYYGTRKKMCKSKCISNMESFKGMASPWNQLKKDFIQFFLFYHSGESLSGIHRIEAQKETNFKMNSV